MGNVEFWRDLGRQLRVDSVRSSDTAGSGHPTSSMSAADLMAVLLSDYLRYDFDNPDDPNNDHLVFSKGHASPLLYAMYKAAGAIDDAEMLTFRKFGSRLQGHPTPVIAWAMGRVQPSIRAAPSRSAGIVSKKPFDIQIASGATSEMCPITIPCMLSSSPRSRNRM